MRKGAERIWAFSFGVAFVIVLISLAIFFPNPTEFQYTVFRVVLALASAGVATMIPGFLNLDVSGWLRAGGALAVFAVTFFYNPATLVISVADSSGVGSPDFEVYSHRRNLDLAGWQLVPDERSSEKISKAVWTDLLEVRRVRESIKAFTIRHATTGQPTPDFWSDTHSIQVQETSELPQGGPRPGLRVFDILVDVSQEPVGSWFELHLGARYWNAFNRRKDVWAAAPVIHPTEKLSFDIQFPEEFPPISWERREGSRDTTTSELVTDGTANLSDDRLLLKWYIDTPKINWVYKVIWEW